MTDRISRALFDTLRQSGIDFFVSVPCKLLGGLIDILQAAPDITYTPVTREEEGMGIMAGAILAGKRPAIIMQNSGFGNSVNAICSLLNYYRLPVVMIVSHRGSDGESIEAQRMMGTAITPLMQATHVAHISLDHAADLSRMPALIDASRAEGRSAAFLLPFSFWREQP